MDIKKIDFKQKKYVLPLIALPFLLLFTYVGAQFAKKDKVEEKPKELSLSLGESHDSIMTKSDAYDAFFKKEDIFRTKITEEMCLFCQRHLLLTSLWNIIRFFHSLPMTV